MYEKHTWENGELITAEKLNNMEDGIEANDVLWVGITGQATFDKTFTEIDEAFSNGKRIIGYCNSMVSPYVFRSYDGSSQKYYFEFYFAYFYEGQTKVMSVSKRRIYSDDTTSTISFGTTTFE